MRWSAAWLDLASASGSEDHVFKVNVNVWLSQLTPTRALGSSEDQSE